MQPHAGEALALAHFLDFMWAERPPRRIEASPWYEAAGSLASRLLLQHTRSAPKVIPLLTMPLYSTRSSELHPQLAWQWTISPVHDVADYRYIAVRLCEGSMKKHAC